MYLHNQLTSKQFIPGCNVNTLKASVLLLFKIIVDIISNRSI